MKRKERVTFILTFAGMLLFVSLLAGRSTVCAQEVSGMLIELQEAVQVRESDDEDAPVIAELDEGTPVIAAGEGRNHTIKIQYQGVVGYIPESAVSIYGEENIESIAQEQKQEELANFRAMEEYEVEQKDKKGSLLFGGLIALFVIAIFGIGIVTALRQEKRKED